MSGPGAVPATAMVLAAGLGTRMRPLTNDRPKALVEVGGRALIDHMLDRLAGAGVARAVVNAHAFADRLIAHLETYGGPLEIVVSDERAHDLPLETGGGIKAARAHLGEAPILVANIDSIWIEDVEPPAAAIRDLCAGFDLETQTARLMLARMERTTGFDGAGDFFIDGDPQTASDAQASSGALIARRTVGTAAAPLNYMGVHIVDPRPIYDWPLTEFGLFPAGGGLWGGWQTAGRLHGAVMAGDWMHVGDPAARDIAEQRLWRQIRRA